MRYGVVYKIVNKINGKSYVGKTTKTIEERLKKHYYSRRSHENCLPRALRKYGIENFAIEEICSCRNKEDLNYMEELLIKETNSRVPYGYNIGAGGEGQPMTPEQYKEIVTKRMTWYRHSPETIEKMRKGNTGKKRTPEALRQMVETRRQRGNLGRKRKNGVVNG